MMVGNYDFFTINFFPLIGLSFLMYFLWRNAHLEKKVRNNFYTLSGLMLIELMIYNLELYLSTISGRKLLISLTTAAGYSLRPVMMYFFIKIVLRQDERKRIRFPLMVPAIVNIGYAFSTFFTRYTYYYDDNNVFHRGPLGWMPHIIVFLYIMFMVLLSLGIQDKKRSFERITIFMICLTIILGAMAETLFGCYAVLRAAIVAGLIFYYMFFQSESYRAAIIGKHIEQTQMSERLSLQMVSALARTVDAKDSYTNGHSQRVADYSKEIAKRLNKSEEFQKEIYYMGLLHDIGKIGVPDYIINKTERLTHDEYSTIKTHPEIGAEVLQDITEMPNLYYGARWHHERYDGKGYPDGLRGDQIPIEARIIAVADVYDAMTSKRSYRDVLPQSVVRSELARAKRTQLDPFIANIMLEMMDEDPDYNMKEHSNIKVENILDGDDDVRPEEAKNQEAEKKEKEEKINEMTEQLRLIIKSEPDTFNKYPSLQENIAENTPIDITNGGGINIQNEREAVIKTEDIDDTAKDEKQPENEVPSEDGNALKPKFE